MRDENDNQLINVTKEGVLGGSSDSLKDERFKTIKLIKDDFKGFYRPPKSLWDDSFIGEAIADDCHPPNSSFLIGGAGGIITGLMTGFFSTNRVPLPVRTPIPFFPKMQLALRSSIIGSSVLWRITKRTLLGTILFAVLECDFKDLVKKPSDKWKGSIVAGACCGGIFGLRGGLPGMMFGIASFALIPGAWELYLRKEQIRSKIFNP